MKGNLRELENKILFGDHSDEEWKKLDKSVNEAFAHASAKERQLFMDSGAGNLLTQIIEYMD